MRIRRYSILCLLAALVLGSCEKDPEVSGTEVKDLAGNWYVRAYDKDKKLLSNSYFSIVTYNTSANTASEMWFEDHFWDTKFKVPVYVSGKSFGGSALKNSDPAYNITITITNGKIIPNGTIGPASKSPTDSIYYEAEYSDEAGEIYYLAGYKRTKFEEDDH